METRRFVLSLALPTSNFQYTYYVLRRLIESRANQSRIGKSYPSGLHKHFRMLAISDYLQSQGYSPVREKHTTIPNIWKKLGTMYNLAGLDERVRLCISIVNKRRKGRDQEIAR